MCNLLSPGAGKRIGTGYTGCGLCRVSIKRALEMSPEVADVAAGRDFANARWDFARANRFLPQFGINSAHSLSPGLKSVGDTPTDQLYLNPNVRNDWDEPKSIYAD